MQKPFSRYSIQILRSPLFFLLAFFMLAVSCDEASIERKGDKALELGEYYVAGEYYRRAYSKTPAKEKELRGRRALKMARCFNHINNTTKALGGYRNAVRYGTISAVDRLDFARALLKNGDYKAALVEFQLLQDSLDNDTSSFNEKHSRYTPEQAAVLVNNGIISAINAPGWKQEGSAYSVKRMDFFNSRRDDYSPCLGGEDNDRLYFSSTRNDAQGDELSGVTGMKAADIFVSEKDDKGKWSKPEPVASGLNTAYDEGACYISADGKEMYFTRCTFEDAAPRYAKVMISNRADASWGEAKEFHLTRDTLSAFAHPAISPDSEWLYFVSDMPGGVGGLDIWRTRIMGGMAMGVENLGEPINTPGNEMFPTFRPNGDLYFSSDGHPGMGGLDIFIYKDSTIIHPGYPLNSQADDFGMTFEGVYNRGYFSTSRNDGRGNDHIWWFENPEAVQLIQGWIYEIDGYGLQEAEAYIVGSDGTNQHTLVKSDGSFEYVAKPGTDYIILGTCNGFLNHKEEITIPADVKESETYSLLFPLANISVPVLIDNIFYEFGKARLLPSSAHALDSLVTMLNDNPNITIELSAHTDFRGSNEFNQKLSQQRAEAVVNYLISKGIAADRLTPVGYGEENPNRIRKKVADHYPWLQEGDVLTEAFINRLKPDEQETANALNRRTEFKVLRTTYNMFDENGNLKNIPKPRKPQVEEPTKEDEFYFDF